MLKILGLDSKVRVYLREGNFSTNSGILNLHPSKGTHCVCYNRGSYFDYSGCPPANKVPNYIKKGWKMYFFEYQIQRNDSLRASYVSF